MNERRVEVLVREGEVVVVLSSVQELRELLASREGRAPAGDGGPPDPAAVDRVLPCVLPVAVQPDVWRRMRCAVSDAEGMFRAMLAGDGCDRREIRDWLAEVESVRRRWTVSERRAVSSQVDEV